MADLENIIERGAEALAFAGSPLAGKLSAEDCRALSRSVVESLATELAAGESWRALALEAAEMDTAMMGIGMRMCGFCRAPCAEGYLPEHRDGCLVLRARALRASVEAVPAGG